MSYLLIVKVALYSSLVEIWKYGNMLNKIGNGHEGGAKIIIIIYQKY